jgi:pyridinium-3,5-biscarboxylic acid mononucleotide synthase
VSRGWLLRLLEEVASGRATPSAAVDRIAWAPVEAVHDPDAADRGTPVARLDHHRALRAGVPEVVFCPGKSIAQVVEICGRFAERGTGFLATRAEPDVQAALAAAFPDARVHPLARTIHQPARSGPESLPGTVLVASAGTADVPVAEEAAVAAAAFGNPVARLYDVGVAGIHRLLAEDAALRGAAVVIVVAGMEGALPSVVGGLVTVPVIAVPTSVGYGASFGGIAALLAMLNSCSAGITVVNIDNGFGAAAAATRINLLRAGCD